MSTSSPYHRPVFVWLVCMNVFVLAMIALGGITRMTESGLSITQWQPILGVIPPLTEADWQERFDLYRKATGQAAALFPNLTLEQFKPLFFWEYAHRLVGRLLGVVFFVPGAIFCMRRMIDRKLAVKLIVVFAAGGLQGAIGWIMVRTGLQQDMTHVSHYSLAAHLCAALAILAALTWLTLNLKPRPADQPARWVATSTVILLALLTLQITYGAFTAGLRAGHFYNTFPTMNGMWTPPGTFGANPLHDLVANPLTIQWTHRWLAWLLAAYVSALWIKGLRGPISCRQRALLTTVFCLTALQFGLGVATLLLHVPVWLGSLHQVNAAVLLMAAVALLQASRPSELQRGTT